MLHFNKHGYRKQGSVKFTNIFGFFLWGSPHKKIKIKGHFVIHLPLLHALSLQNKANLMAYNILQIFWRTKQSSNKVMYILLCSEQSYDNMKQEKWCHVESSTSLSVLGRCSCADAHTTGSRARKELPAWPQPGCPTNLWLCCCFCR